ncbi:MAG: ribosome small subunit-dependent GTPase A [Anaeroplasma sp.]
MKKGKVININSGVYNVLLDTGENIYVKARGKLRNEKKYIVNKNSNSKKLVPTYIKNSPKVGDIVYIDNDMIDHYEERINELIRPDIANVDQILLVFAAKEPDFSYFLLDLFIINIVNKNILPCIVITKIDKLTTNELEDLKNNMKYYTKMGYTVLYVNSLTKDGISSVEEVLIDKTTVLSGQTGAGKSTLINAIIPDFSLKTQEISQALGRGKHTTRQTSLYKYKTGFIGDTPGFSKLEALELDKTKLSSLFVDFAGYKCKFKDCNHSLNIKGCAIVEAVNKGIILKSRYENYIKILKQLGEN